jgi:hypothetical protein
MKRGIISFLAVVVITMFSVYYVVKGEIRYEQSVPSRV